MAVLIGQASISENNTVNGVAGDQTNKEVCSRTFYSKPWSYLLRCKNQTIASNMVIQCIKGIQNSNIGYSQATRNTAYWEAKKVGYDLSKITTPCNTDCSAFITLVAICAGVKQLEYSTNAPTTSSILKAFKDTGLFDVCPYPELINTEQYLMLGDILLAPGKHVALVLEDGPVAKAQRNGQPIVTNTPTPTSTVPVSVPATTLTLPANIRKGIDVSAYNVISDYKAVKNAGIQFAILKVIRKDLQEDKLFKTHLSGFKNVGIPIEGVYNYSYATTVDKAKIDAQTVVQVLKKYSLKYRIYLDIEDNCQKNLGVNLINIINTYQSIIENAGYQFGLYTGLSFYNSYIKPYKQYLRVTNEWIARYPSSSQMSVSTLPDMSKKPNIDTNIEGWQYSSKGVVNGINGFVDLNLMFDLTTKTNSKIGTVYNCNKLNFRSTPNKEIDTNKISVLLAGEQVVILGTEGEWLKVQYNNLTGYVSSKYIKY